MKKYVLRQADLKMQDMDSNKDGKISWEEYRETQYPSSTEKGEKFCSIRSHSNQFKIFFFEEISVPLGRNMKSLYRSLIALNY